MFSKEDTKIDLRPKGAGDMTEKELNRLRCPGQLPSSMFVRSTVPESESEELVKQLPKPKPEPKKPRPKPVPEVKSVKRPQQQPKPVKELDFDEQMAEGRRKCIRTMTDLVREQAQVVKKEQEALERYQMALDIYVHGLPQEGKSTPE